MSIVCVQTASNLYHSTQETQLHNSSNTHYSWFGYTNHHPLYSSLIYMLHKLIELVKLCMQ